MSEDSASLRQRIAELESQTYVPGLWRCAKCGFTLQRLSLRASDGAVGGPVDDEPGERCQNDGSPLWRVTERDAGNAMAERLEEEYRLRRRWEELALGRGVCPTCAMGAPDPLGCSDCMNTGWVDGAPRGYVDRDQVDKIVEALLVQRLQRATAAINGGESNAPEQEHS